MTLEGCTGFSRSRPRALEGPWQPDSPGFLLGGVRSHLYRGGQITPSPQSRPGDAQVKGRQGAVSGRGALQGRRVQRLGGGLPEGEFRLSTYDLCDLD